MTRTREERLLKWLQDAYTMEQEAETMMSTMAGRIEHYPELRQRIEQHVQETRQQSSSIKRCIEILGGSLPTAKSLVASMMAAMHAAGNSMMDDEVAKGLGISYAFEHMEIATYRALIIAADEAGQVEIGQACASILEEEVAMAEWLMNHQEDIIRAFLARDVTPGEPAKR